MKMQSYGQSFPGFGEACLAALAIAMKVVGNMDRPGDFHKQVLLAGSERVTNANLEETYLVSLA